VLVNFESDWFKSYCKAVIDSDAETMHANVRLALDRIHERLGADGLSQEEREAMQAAMRYLAIIDLTDISRAS
jgi:hypothetical protein